MTEFVAEIGANHNGDLDRALELIRTAAHAGCDAVKFQWFGARGLYANDVKANPVGFPWAWRDVLRREAASCGVRFGMSVFDPESAREWAHYVDFLKVSSYSVLDWKLIKAVAETGKPMVIGTGMASLTELDSMMVPLHGRKDRLTLLHCVSAYPVMKADCHLANIGLLRRTYGCAVGWSDHSASPDVILRAAGRWRAEMVECHLDLRDAGGEEFAGGHCLRPLVLRDIITAVRRGEAADGVAGKPVAAELHERPWRADATDGLRPSQELRRTGSTT